jgi:hypothetical protein
VEWQNPIAFERETIEAIGLHTEKKATEIDEAKSYGVSYGTNYMNHESEFWVSGRTLFLTKYVFRIYTLSF